MSARTMSEHEERTRRWESEYLWELATPSYPAVRRDPEPESE